MTINILRPCPECKRLVEPSSIRACSKTKQGYPARYACLECFNKIASFRRQMRPRGSAARSSTVGTS